MRLHELRLQGFGPFAAEQVVDFSSLDADGVFLIAGPTGAGKSSLLDAVSFALYDRVPRYGEAVRVRSDLAGPDEPTTVSLIFSLGARVFRVERSPAYERQKRRGEGTTLQAAKAHLAERVDGGWEAVAERVGAVNSEIGVLIGLRAEEFQQVILLAQGKFGEFLHADSDTRKALLQRLFGTARFARLSELLNDDRRAAAAGAAASRAAIELHLTQLQTILERDERVPEHEIPDALARLEADAAASADVRSASAAERERAHTALQAARAVAELQAQRANAHQQLAELNAHDAEVDECRQRLALAARAETVAAELARNARATHAASAAADEARRVEAEALLLFGSAPADVATAAAEAADLAARLVDAEQTEALLPSLAAEATAAERDRTAAAEALAAVSAELAERPELRSSLDAQRAEATLNAAGLERASSDRESARARVRAATALASHTAERDEAVAEQRVAYERFSRANARYRELIELRLTGYAAELADTLGDGEPCPVCGAVEHPSPAVRHTEVVDAADVEAAKALADSAWSANSAAEQLVQSSEREAQALLAATGGLTLDDATAAADRAEAAYAACENATSLVATLTEQLQAFDADSAAAQQRMERASAAERESAERVLLAKRALSETTARIEHERGTFESVAERRASALAQHTAAAQWHEAHKALATANDERDAAAAELLGALESAEFSSEADARAAMLPANERTALQHSVTAHDEALARVRGVLAQQHLIEAPEEPVATDSLEAAAIRAAEAHDTATAAAATAQERVRAARQSVRAAEAAIAERNAHAATLETLELLASDLRGANERHMDVETFVLAAKLEAIVTAANVRLDEMSEGRFELVHDDSLARRGRASGLGLAVLDAHTGVARPVQSLSGGETFLASLSLALGLADVVQGASGGVTLETLFIDEGFGALDADTLELALAALDDLRAGGRTIGVISHVQQMQEQLPTRIRVEPVAGGGSRVVQQR